MKIVEKCRQIHPNFDGRTARSSSKNGVSFKKNKSNHSCLGYAEKEIFKG